MPSLAVDGAVTPILHVSQLAAALGLPEPEAAPSARLAWDATAVLRAWLDHLRPLTSELLTRPTPSRGRSLRNLTVNVFHPFELLPAAWHTGRFDWNPDGDAEREARLTAAEQVVGYAARAYVDWSDFLLEDGRELERRDPRVASPRGEVLYSALLDSQRTHAAFHYRQLVEFLRAEGAPPRDVLPLERLAGLELPAQVF